MSTATYNTPDSETGHSVSVVIPCRNEIAFIDSCLTDLLTQEKLPKKYEIVIADGESNDGTATRLAAIAARNPQVRIVSNSQRIVPTGLNAAILAARGDVIIRADVHTRYAKDYVAECLAALRSSGAACVGGPWRAAGVSYFQRAVAAAFHSPWSSGGALSHAENHEGEVDSVYLGCWLKNTLLEIGLFDEALVRNQDDELSLRLQRRGHRIWQTPRIRSWYYPRDSFGKLFRQYFQYGYWKVAVIRKHRLPASWRHLVPMLAVLGGVGLALGSLLSTTAATVLVVMAGAWLCLALAATLRACRRVGQWDIAPVLPVVFAIYHLAYGLGFLRGLVDVIRRRLPVAKRVTELTR